MLLIVCKVTNMYIKVNGFMIRRLISEAEAIKTSLLNHKLQLLASLVAYVINLFARRTLYLIISKLSEVNDRF